MGNAATTAVTYEFGEYRLAPAQRLLTHADGAAVRLGGKAFDTLVYLVEHAGELLDRDVILEAIWPKRVVEDNNLNQAVATLRRVLGEEHVATVAGRGYQFVTPVRRVDRTAESTAPSAPAAAQDSLPPPPPSRSPRLALTAAAAAGIAVIGLLALGPWATGPSLTLLDTRVTVQPLTTYPGEELTPALSPDAARVAFSWRPPQGHRGIYVTQVGGGEPIRLSEANTGDDVYPAWSPDGESIAFLRLHDPTRFEVLVMPALGGTPRKLYTGDRWSVSVEGNPLLAWSPDGQYLLFTALRDGEDLGGRHSLRRLTVASAQVEELELRSEPTHYDTSPAISADGRWLAFTRFTRAQRLNQVMVQRLGPGLVPSGEPEVAAGIAPDIHHSLHWSSAGDRLWFASTSQIFEWTPGRSPRAIHTLGTQLTTSAMAIAARGSGARAVVVMRRSNADIFSLPLDPVTHAALGPREALLPSAATDQHPSVSPDGRSLAFVSDRGGTRDLWLTDIDGSRPHRLTNMGQLIVGFPRWSPDGQSISFHTSAPDEDRVIHRVDVESGITSRLFNGCCPGGWTADGQSLYVTELGTVSHIARVDLATGHRERLFVGDLAIESADSQFVLFAKVEKPGYFRRAIGGTEGVGAETRLVDDYRVASGGIAPVADGFFYIAFTDEGAARALRFYDYASGEARDIADVPPRVAIGLSVTPDARRIFYAAIGGEPEADLDVIDFAPAEQD